MAKKILIVDDEADLVDMISARLIHEGYEVHDAQNGYEAIGHFLAAHHEQNPFQLIILDIKMPGISGIEVLKALRKEEELRGIKLGTGVPVIMLTALQHPMFESFSEGCDDFILKPYDETVLLKKVQEKLGSGKLN